MKDFYDINVKHVFVDSLYNMGSLMKRLCKEFDTNSAFNRKDQCLLIWGGGGKALTMTLTPWNLPHGQWSKKLTMTMTPSILPMVNGQIDQI